MPFYMNLQLNNIGVVISLLILYVILLQAFLILVIIITAVYHSFIPHLPLRTPPDFMVACYYNKELPQEAPAI